MAWTDLIDTVVIVMMENRSFDHVLGHLRFDGLNPNVDGLTKPPNQSVYSNLFETGLYYPFQTPDRPYAFDPPHEYDAVATQLARSANGKYTMSGFVEAYVTAEREAAVKAGQTAADAKNTIVPGPHVECLGFLHARDVPITTFLATQFAVCHHWHASLPTSTQPNRTMALCGDTRIADTKSRLIPADDMVLDWLDRAGVRWRVYSDGLPFFALYPSAWDHMMGENFRRFETLLRDCKEEPDGSFPQVLIVEPSYASAPHIGSDRPNDNHPPVPMGFGEDFVRDVYDAVTANAARWARTVMILYYDEHGGFYDHVAPPRIPYTVRNNGAVVRTFDSLGIRVPAVVVSPLADEGVPVDPTLDHTSVLQLMAELFTPGAPYSATVDTRRQAGIASASVALTRTDPRPVIPRAPTAAIPAMANLDTRAAPRDTMQEAFEQAAVEFIAHDRGNVGKHYPDLIHWEHSVALAPGGPR